MPDELLDQAARHIADDHARDDRLDAVRRYVEALTTSPDVLRRQVGAELAEIVGAPC